MIHLSNSFRTRGEDNEENTFLTRKGKKKKRKEMNKNPA